MAISIGEPGEGGEFEGGVLDRVVAELRCIDHLRVGSLRWPPSCRLCSEAAVLLPESDGALSLWVTRFRKLDMLRRRFELLKVGRLEVVGAMANSWSATDVVVVVGDKAAPAARGVSWDSEMDEAALFGALFGGVAPVSSARGGLEPGVVPAGTAENEAALASATRCSWATSGCMS